MQAVYEAAQAYLGLEEYPGARHNQTIIDFAAATGNEWVQDDETPWCASFVGAVLAQCGIQGTGRLNARSYLDWGTPVKFGDAVVGDVVVFWRGSPDGWQGHVGFYAGVRGDQVLVLGGNQGNKVSIAEYPKSRLLGVRRTATPRTSPAQSTTMQASAAQIGTAAAGGVTAVAALDGQAQTVALVFVGIVALAAVWIMRERLKKWSKGIR
jgi:uncharacterized protein (TIGR02594 family)